MNANTTNNHNEDALFELIESMSASEKRYFNVQVKNHQNNDNSIPDYFIFFQILNKMKSYDEEKAKTMLLKKLGKKGFSNFGVKKAELYETLFRHLKNYHYVKMKKSAAFIKVLIQDANFLFKRGLYKQAKRNLRDARKMAERCDDTLSLIEINRFEREFLRANREIKKNEYLKQLHEEENRLLKNLTQEAQLKKDFDILSAYTVTNPKISDHESVDILKNEFQHLVEMADNREMSKVARRFLIGSLSIYYRLIGDNEEQFKIGKALFEWWEENDLWREQMPHYYIGTLSNYLGIFHRKKEYNKFIEILEKIEKMQPTNQHEATVRFHRLILFRQLYYMNTGLIDEACSLSKRVEKGLNSFRLNRAVQITIIYNCIVSFFVNHKFEECLKWIDFLEPFKKKKIKKFDIQVSQLLKVISNYEIGNMDELEKSVVESRKYFLKYSADFELFILEQLVEYSEVIPNKQKEILNRIQQYLIKTKSSKERFRDIGIEELLLWEKSKRTERTMKNLLLDDIRKKS